MKKIISVFLFIFLLFGGFNYVSASNQSKVINIMNNFYLKLDKSISDIEKKINKLEIISNKIESIKKNKWNKLSNNSKELISLIESNINNKINFYKKELENQKEEINISDLLGGNDLDAEIEEEDNSNNYSGKITALELESENFKKTYYSSTLVKGEKLKLGKFEINSNKNDIKIELEFMDYDGYPAIDLENLYLEDNYGNKIYYDNTLASLGSTRQVFNNVIGGREYVLYGIVKIYYSGEEKIWLSINRINDNWIGRVLSHIEYRK